MSDGPTIINGPLHTDDATLSDRKILAYFATVDEANAVRDALVEANISAGSITVGSAVEEAFKLRPSDPSVMGRIREALLPEDSEQATRDAVASEDVMLSVIPDQHDVGRIVDIIQAANPHHFDADLERWRNSPPNS